MKQIIEAAEDTRISMRISELESNIYDEIELEQQTKNVKALRFNLHGGQQCVRDFFICLHENVLSWPDVCSIFNFKITHSTRCLSCDHLYTHETELTYLEISVPPDNSDLNDSVEEFFNIAELVGKKCESCKKFVEAEKRNKLTQGSASEFILVILTRGSGSPENYHFVDNRTRPLNNVFIR